MTATSTAQSQLFQTDDLLPPGLSFEPCFVSAAEEAALIDVARRLPLLHARHREYTARRRVHAFGSRRDPEDERLEQAAIGDLPQPLVALRERLAAWAGLRPADFIHVMVAEYSRGTPLGWHRDAPAYGLIAGVSLAGPARLRLRPYPPRPEHAARIIDIALEPRSAYVMRDTARWGWQHSVPPVPALRYSVTMRTARV